LVWALTFYRNLREVNYAQFCKEVDDFTDVSISPEKKTFVSSTYVPQDVVHDVKNLDLASNLYLSKKLGVKKEIYDNFVMINKGWIWYTWSWKENPSWSCDEKA